MKSVRALLFLSQSSKCQKFCRRSFLKVTHAGVTESRSHLLVPLPWCPQGRVNHLRVIAMRMGQSRTWLAQAVASHQTVVQSQRDVTQSTRALCPAGRMGIGSSVSQVLHLTSSTLQFRGPALIKQAANRSFVKLIREWLQRNNFRNYASCPTYKHVKCNVRTK